VKEVLRVAYFPDSYLEVNGVAMTSKRLTDFARRRGLPFVCVHAGRKTEVVRDENLTFISLKRSPLSFAMDEELKYDPLFQRHVGFVRRELEKFRPDVFHITGLNDVSIIGAYLAWKMGIAMTASWHTNLHEYAARRLEKMLKFLPEKPLASFTGFIEEKILEGAKLYYKMPQIILAPNRELIEMLEKGTGRKTNLMIRGVDTKLFSPEKRTVNDNITRFGYVGRLRAEKNVRMLAEMEEELLKAGRNNFKFLIVGEGSERAWLEQNMKTAEFTGFLEGGQLAEAYANMDIFVFPSETDTYGNVPQEAMASGAPVLVTGKGGPKYIVRHGETGFICENLQHFVRYALELMDEPEKLMKMKQASLEFARSRSWDAVFESVYQTYSETKETLDAKRRRKKEEQQKSSLNNGNRVEIRKK
jgi:phosphatidylinositol alpha 1,6-mannosyltransferase